MKIAVIDEDPVRGALVERGLRASGVREVRLIESTAHLLNNLVAYDPDIVIIDLDDPARDVLEQMFAISRLVRRPVAMFVGKARDGDVERAVEAGVSAYVVDGLRPDRIRPVVDAAVTRYRAFAKLQDELDAARTELDGTRTALAERRDVERAKALLIRRRGLTEDEAHEALRSRAMRERIRIGQVARGLLEADGLLQPPRTQDGDET